MTAGIGIVTRVECTPWCTDGAGHGDAEEAADQSCYGPEHRIRLAPLPDHFGSLPRGRVVAHLYRDVYQGVDDAEPVLEPAHIEVQTTELDALRLSSCDARTLGALLIRLADEADAGDSTRTPTDLAMAQIPRMAGGQFLWRCDI